MKEAKIECTEDLFANVIEQDEESRKLQSMPRFREIFQNHDQNIQEFIEVFQKDMKKLNKDKKNVIAYCEQVLRDAEIKAEKDSIELIRVFESYKKHRLR